MQNSTSRGLAIRLAGHAASQTLSSEVYIGLKADILRCRFQPGQVIKESELISRYGVSNTPVREALKRLSQEGLTHPIPSIGYLVSPLDLDDLRDLQCLRGFLDQAAVELAAQRATDAQLEELDLLASKPQPAFLVDEEACAHWYEDNLQFHLAIARAGGSPRLVRAVRSAIEETSRAHFLMVGASAPPPFPVSSHKAIVQALHDRERELAKRLALGDVQEGLRFVERAFELMQQ